MWEWGRGGGVARSALAAGLGVFTCTFLQQRMTEKRYLTLDVGVGEESGGLGWGCIQVYSVSLYVFL